jgi:hypothetical protein
MNEKKYGNTFSSSLLLKALVYFDDAETTSIPEIDREWSLIKDFFTEKIKEIFQ